MAFFKIFEDVVWDQGEAQQYQNFPILETNNFHINLDDWILAQCDGQEFPGEDMTTVGVDFEVSVMQEWQYILEMPINRRQVSI